MPRYFFNVREKSDLSPEDVSQDLEGQEFPDLDAAKREAERAVREMIGERVLHGGDLGGRKIEIADERGDVLAVVPAGDVIFREGHFRSFTDDVTKSAPVANPISAKPSAK